MTPLYKKYLFFRSRVAVFIDDMKSDTKIPFFTRMKCLFKGFLSNAYYLYDFKNNDHKNYLSEYERKKTRFINGRDAYLLNNKFIFDNLVRDFIETPTIYSLILKGKIYPHMDEPIIDSVDRLIDQIKEEDKIVIKPYIDADSGRGIYICEYKNGRIYFNNTEFKREDIVYLISELDKYIVTKYIEQHKYSANIYSNAVNTMRIITMEDPYTREVFIPIAVHRFGSKASGNVDNWGMGGLSAKIDLDSGVLSKATTKPIYDKKVWYSHHPDTGAEIEGVKVPKWDLIKEKILFLAEYMPYLKYVGWDVLITKDGEIAIMEANNCSGVNVLQAHGPLLANKRVKEFYKYYNII